MTNLHSPVLPKLMSMFRATKIIKPIQFIAIRSCSYFAVHHKAKKRGLFVSIFGYKLKRNKMNSLKWLKRKYPNSFEELNDYFDRHELENFKKSTMKIGRLTKDVVWCQKYKKGSIIQFRKSNPINDFNHPFVYAILKCQVGYTESGYHSFNITENDFTEIKS